MKRYVAMFFFAALALSLASCTQRYVVTTPLEAPLPQPIQCRIGAIIDGLPVGFEEDKKPTAEEIDEFKANLQEQLNKGGWLTISELQDTTTTEYAVTGSINEYKRGSGVARFFIGFGAGTARVRCTLQLTDASTQTVLFGGEFSGSVSDWSANGRQMFTQVAKDFAKAIDKGMSKLGPKKSDHSK